MPVISDPQTSRAVLIGVSQYMHLEPLEAVSNNLNDLSAALTDPHIWGLPSSHVTIVSNPVNASEVSDAIRGTAAVTTDTLLVYFAGHGLTDHYTAELLLALRDAQPGHIEKTLPYMYLRKELLKPETVAKRKIVILDCCFAARASAMSGNVSDETAIDGAYVLAACGPTRLARSIPGHRNTVFTGELLTALHHGISGASDPLTMETIYGHLWRACKSQGHEVPHQMATNAGMRFAIAYNRARSANTVATQTQTPTPPTEPNTPNTATIPAVSPKRVNTRRNASKPTRSPLSSIRQSKGRMILSIVMVAILIAVTVYIVNYIESIYFPTWEVTVEASDDTKNDDVLVTETLTYFTTNTSQGTSVVAADPDVAKPKWQTTLQQKDPSIQAADDGSVLLVGNQHGSWTALSSSDGTVLWHLDKGAVFSFANIVLHEQADRLRALDIYSGEQKWSRPLDGVSDWHWQHRTPAQRSTWQGTGTIEHLVEVHDNGSLFSVDVQTGDAVSIQAGLNPDKDFVKAFGSLVVTGPNPLRAYDIDNLKFQWDQDIEQVTSAQACGVVYVCVVGAKITVLDEKSGEIKAAWDIPGEGHRLQATSTFIVLSTQKPRTTHLFLGDSPVVKKDRLRHSVTFDGTTPYVLADDSILLFQGNSDIEADLTVYKGLNDPKAHLGSIDTEHCDVGQQLIACNNSGTLQIWDTSLKPVPLRPHWKRARVSTWVPPPSAIRRFITSSTTPKNPPHWKSHPNGTSCCRRSSRQASSVAEGDDRL